MTPALPPRDEAPETAPKPEIAMIDITGERS
jgi:hypothetical protein